jgi:hypothetical protein
MHNCAYKRHPAPLSGLINYYTAATQTVTTFDNIGGFCKVATLQVIKLYGG